jgi:hypothetical protein
MKTEIIRFLDFRKKVRFENVNLVYESDSAVLVEVDSESIWLRKSEIKLEKIDNDITLEMPRWLAKRKLEFFDE